MLHDSASISTVSGYIMLRLCEAHYAVRDIRRLKRRNIRFRKLYPQRGNSVIQMRCLRRTYDGRRNLGEHPSKRYLSTWQAVRFCDFRHCVHDFLIGIRSVRIERLAKLVGSISRAAFIPIARKPPTASGLHGMTAIPSALHSGSISRSSSR